MSSVKAKIQNGFPMARFTQELGVFDVISEEDDSRICVVVRTDDGYRRVWIAPDGLVYCDGVEAMAEPCSGTIYDDERLTEDDRQADEVELNTQCDNNQ